MDLAALLLAALALLVAVVALARSGGAAAAQDDLRGELERTRRLLARVADGASPGREAILEGQLWRDVDPDEARALVEAGDVLVVDVRTPGETVSGVIAGARLIPMDELEERKDELPRDRAVLLYCAVGGRSAAACEGLAREGWDTLLNLTGGFSEWRGPVDRPS